MTPIAITGSTGRLGGKVAHLLAAAGVPQRLIVRDPSRAPHLPNADVAVAAYADGVAVQSALQGIDTVLMVSASEAPNRVEQHRSFVDAAGRAGVRHLVYLSFVGAAPNATFTLARDHWSTEEHILASGMTYTFLRDNLYADFFEFMVGEDGVLAGPAGDGRVAAVAQVDIAEVAATVLQDQARYAGCRLDLTGPESLNLDQVAAVITEVTGRPVRYQRESLAEAYASRQGYGAPGWQVDAWVSTYTGIASGELAYVSPDIPSVLGRPATPLAQVVAGRVRPGVDKPFSR